MSSDTSRTTTWWLEPREPLVFGGGTPTPALAVGNSFWMPPQSTAAGMVRATMVADHLPINKAEALDLLEVAIAGPWLGRRPTGGADPQPWLPMPHDLTAIRPAGGRSEETLVRGSLLEPGTGESVSWLDGEALPLLVHVPAKVDGCKTRPPRSPFWPLRDAVEWALSDRPEEPWSHHTPRPVTAENRVHVKIARDVYTAEPEMLFSTPGVRFGEGEGGNSGERFGLLVEVTDHRGRSAEPGPAAGTPPRLVHLGGEGRTAALEISAGSSYPTFDQFRERYEKRLDELGAADALFGLRLQLVTPGCFGGWQPAWEDDLAGAEVQGVAMHRYQPVSGWDLQNRRPRAVRRLVPAGAVFFLGPFDSAERVLALCRTWWTRPLRGEIRARAKSFQADPAADGYGRVLPAPCDLRSANTAITR